MLTVADDQNALATGIVPDQPKPESKPQRLEFTTYRHDNGVESLRLEAQSDGQVLYFFLDPQFTLAWSAMIERRARLAMAWNAQLPARVM